MRDNDDGGGMVLIDEISLADDSVLERLNSVLEPERTLLLAEKGGGDEDVVETITAGEKFRVLATMNPGGDYGKKEVRELTVMKKCGIDGVILLRHWLNTI